MRSSQTFFWFNFIPHSILWRNWSQRSKKRSRKLNSFITFLKRSWYIYFLKCNWPINVFVFRKPVMRTHLNVEIFLWWDFYLFPHENVLLFKQASNAQASIPPILAPAKVLTPLNAAKWYVYAFLSSRNAFSDFIFTWNWQQNSFLVQTSSMVVVLLVSSTTVECPEKKEKKSFIMLELHFSTFL